MVSHGNIAHNAQQIRRRFGHGRHSHYWGRPLDSRRAFNGRLADGRGPFLRTGDLGICVDGECYVTGRQKDLIIIRGQNYYPQDLENAVESAVTDVKPATCIAFEVETDGQRGVCMVAEIERTARRNVPLPVLDGIRQAVLSRCGLSLAAVVVVQPGKTLKTSSGKVQRGLTKEFFLGERLDIWASWLAR